MLFGLFSYYKDFIIGKVNNKIYNYDGNFFLRMGLEKKIGGKKGGLEIS